MTWRWRRSSRTGRSSNKCVPNAPKVACHAVDATHQPKWYTLESRRRTVKKKNHEVSGEILLQFALVDPNNPNASPADILRKFRAAIKAEGADGDGEEDEDDFVAGSGNEQDEPDNSNVAESSDETDDAAGSEVREKRRRRLRLRRLKRKSIAARAYEFSGASSGIDGLVFMEISKITDLPPEKNGKHGIPVELQKSHSADLHVQ